MCWLRASGLHFLGVDSSFEVLEKPSFYSLSNCYVEINRFSSKQGGVRIAVICSVAPSHILTFTELSEMKDKSLLCDFLLAACLRQFPF